MQGERDSAYTAVHTAQPDTPRSNNILMMGTKKIDGMDRTALNCSNTAVVLRTHLETGDPIQ